MLCAAIGLWAACVLPAFAEPPVTLASGYVTDMADVLGGDTARVEAALEQLNEDHNVQLFVVFVDTFDSMGSQAWTDAAAEANGLGLNDMLLAIAVLDRQYAWSVDADFKLTDAELEDVAASDIEPHLQDDDWAGAAIAAADGYGDALAAADGGSHGTDGETDGGTGASAGPSFLGCCLPVILLAIGGGLVTFFVSRKRRAGSPVGVSAGDAAPSTKELETKAGKLLVDVDDALQTSEQEIGFAEAEFGATAVQEYRTVLDEAKKGIAEAFRIQQQMYDAHPEPEATKREMLQSIIAIASAADGRLDEKAEGFAGLRDLAGRADEALAAMTKRLDAVQAALPAASATLAGLKDAYLASALGEVADDDVQATELLAFARSSADKASGAITAGDRGAAALSIRAAEDAVAQAERLLAAVSAASDGLAKARQDAGTEVAALERSAASAESQGTAEFTALAASARSVAAQARAALAAPPLDPLAQLTAIRAAALQLENAFGAARDAAARLEAWRAYMTGALKSTRERIASVEAFVSTRRGAIGPEARSNLEEARARMASAETLAGSNPEQAHADVQAAQQYAEAAAKCAQADVAAYERTAYSGVPRTSDTGGVNAGAIIAGTVLAGVLRDVITDSGGGFSGGGGGFSPGSFGGSGHRGGGGGFGGGGHRGGGGRF